MRRYRPQLFAWKESLEKWIYESAKLNSKFG